MTTTSHALSIFLYVNLSTYIVLGLVAVAVRSFVISIRLESRGIQH